jgi:hypothetical protein
MPWFLNKKDKVRFYNTIPGLATANPVILAQDLKREWVKKNVNDLIEYNSHIENVAKCPVTMLKQRLGATFLAKCPGIRKILNTGYIVPLPFDLTIETNGDREHIMVIHQDISNSVYNETAHQLVDKHNPKVFHDYTPVPRSSVKTLLKVNTCWNVIPDDDYVYLVTSVEYSNEDRFTVASGILDPYINSNINITLYWHVLNGRETVKAGTPLVQLIPIPRNMTTPQLEVYEAGEKEKWMAKAQKMILQVSGAKESYTNKVAVTGRKLWEQFKHGNRRKAGILHLGNDNN